MKSEEGEKQGGREEKGTGISLPARGSRAAAQWLIGPE